MMTERYINTDIAMPGCKITSGGDEATAGFGEVGACLCDRLGAITALEARHCTFETLFAKLSEGTEPIAKSVARWETGLKFLRVPNLRSRQVRFYDLWRVHERLRYGNVVEVRLAPLTGLRLRVRRDPAKPEFLDMSYLLGKRDFGHLRLHPVQIKRKEFPLYAEVECVLEQFLKSRALTDSPTSVRKVTGELRQITGRGSSPQYTNFVDGLGSDLKDGQSFRERIREEVDSLWDAPLLDKYGVKPLEDLINKWSRFSKEIVQYTPERQLPMLRAMLPPDQLVTHYKSADALNQLRLSLVL